MPFARLRQYLKARARHSGCADTLYVSAVRQARDPAFYTRCGVADTIDGRFDLIVIHVFLVVRALRKAGEPGDRVGDQIFKVMMDDMDLNLREMGVGDLSVGKKVKAMARAYYGRAMAYGSAIDAEKAATSAAEGAQTLESVLRRNVYGSLEPEPGELEALAAYVRAAEAALDEQPVAALFDGKVRFEPVQAGPAAKEPEKKRTAVLERVDP